MDDVRRHLLSLPPLSYLDVFARVCIKEGVRWMTLVAIYFSPPPHLPVFVLCPKEKTQTLTLTECCSPPVFLLYPEVKTGSSP